MVIENCIKKYSDSYFEDMFGVSNTKAVESYSRALRFLSDFALDDNQYLQECVPIMQSVFNPVKANEFDIHTSSFNILFQKGFNMSLQISSPMFTEETYCFIQIIFQACGDHYFYIVEDSADNAAFHLKIPTTTSWKQLLSGGFISAVLFNMPYNNYRVFGDSGSWGKLCNYENSWSDYEIFGSKLDTPEIRNYNKQMALSVDDFLYLQNNIGFPPSIRILSDVTIPDSKLTDDRYQANNKRKDLSLYVK